MTCTCTRADDPPRTLERIDPRCPLHGDDSRLMDRVRKQAKAATR